MKRHTSLLVASLFFCAGAAQAQGRDNRGQKHQEAKQNKQELKDDRRDVRELREVLGQFDRAQARRDERAMREVEDRLRHLVRAELAEGSRELDKDRQEIRRDGRGGGWDDRKDRRDDVRDYQQERAMQSTRASVARELSGLVGQRGRRELDRTRTLIVQLIDMGQHEVQQTQQEIREDRRDDRRDHRR
ncbi:hypothetical protein [Archangium primigenium]|uniref:hypothetical protein n=1 Tax=[Archangium] primigenium TaxID=2792470 RepID=UPI00195C9B22|nr:hypothetical protein [Archangium primigenium]MBM7112728.1 hypothetical protein [Archangium primigenium]